MADDDDNVVVDGGDDHVVTVLCAAAQGGFWRGKGAAKVWVTLERVQFVGACNPPTDPGRFPLSQRFLRHAPVVLVDFPVTPSLYQIYGAFNRALLKLQVCNCHCCLDGWSLLA